MKWIEDLLAPYLDENIAMVRADLGKPLDALRQYQSGNFVGLTVEFGIVCEEHHFAVSSFRSSGKRATCS